MRTILKPTYSRLKKPVRRSKRTKFLERAMEFQVPALPQHVRTVLALSTARDMNAARLARAILRDYGITLRCYRVLNSAFFSPGRRQVLSMRFITVLLGQNNLARIISGTPVLPVTQHELMDQHKYALIFMAQSLAARELASCLADNYNMETDKIVPCTMLRNFDSIITAFLSPRAGKLIFEAPETERVAKDIKRMTGWIPAELAITLAQRWNMPELITKTLYPFNEIKQGLSRNKYRIVLMAHAINKLVSLAEKRGSSGRQRDIRLLMIKKLGVSQKGIGKAFQEGINNFRKKNPFFHELLEKNDMLRNLLI